MGLIAASLLLGSAHPRKMNAFTYAAIVEVAVLFLGIFICKQPALQICTPTGRSCTSIIRINSSGPAAPSPPTQRVFLVGSFGANCQPGRRVATLLLDVWHVTLRALSSPRSSTRFVRCEFRRRSKASTCRSSAAWRTGKTRWFRPRRSGLNANEGEVTSVQSQARLGRGFHSCRLRSAVTWRCDRTRRITS
jgi:hypothetical protein